MSGPKPKVRTSEEGYTERRCCRCLEWWPLTVDFFQVKRPEPRPLWWSYCRACRAEMSQARRSKTN